MAGWHRYGDAPRPVFGRCATLVAATAMLASAAAVGRLDAAEPARFAPADRVAPLPRDVGNELGLSSVVTASFLRLVDEPATDAAGKDERTPEPTAAAGNDGQPATTAPLPGPGSSADTDDDDSAIERAATSGALPPGNPKDPDTLLPPPAKPSEYYGGAVDERDEPLLLAEVLRSVQLHYPLLQAIERERGIASGRLTTAMGAFDTNVGMSGNALAPGTYENYRSDFGLTQLFPTAGISAFGGFRTGYGDFTTYNLAQKTATGGEWRGGVTMPLARNRDIDRPRATRDQARLDISLAEPVIERSRLDYMRGAARNYWSWLGNGERLDATEELVELAVERDTALETRVQRGAAANIERIDNLQNIALRNGLVVKADRSLQQSTIDLSLFLRDDGGRPLLASRRRIRAMAKPVAPDRTTFDAALSRALAERPEFARLALQREKLVVERRFAANQVQPVIDGQLVGNQDAAFGKSPLSGPDGLDRQVLQASLVFQLPAQRRDARGRLQTIDSQLIQLDRQLQYAEDNVRAEVQDAFSLLERAYEFHKQAVRQAELATLVARAEREQLRLGRSDILRVTLREQAKFDAQILEILARQEYWRAESDLRAADTSLGRDGMPIMLPVTLPSTDIPLAPQAVPARPPQAVQARPPEEVPLPPPAR
ncbi:MAG: TolC family protein [Pirellulales bacterium]